VISYGKWRPVALRGVSHKALYTAFFKPSDFKIWYIFVAANVIGGRSNAWSARSTGCKQTVAVELEWTNVWRQWFHYNSIISVISVTAIAVLDCNIVFYICVLAYHWGAYSTPTDSIAWLKEGTEGRVGKGRGAEGRKENGRERFNPLCGILHTQVPQLFFSDFSCSLGFCFSFFLLISCVGLVR